MAVFSVTVTTKLAWWVLPYLCALQFFGELTGLQPDAEKAADLIARRGITIKMSDVTRTGD